MVSQQALGMFPVVIRAGSHQSRCEAFVSGLWHEACSGGNDGVETVRTGDGSVFQWNAVHHGGANEPSCERGDLTIVTGVSTDVLLGVGQALRAMIPAIIKAEGHAMTKGVEDWVASLVDSEIAGMMGNGCPLTGR
jgi:hypothetical protein